MPGGSNTDVQYNNSGAFGGYPLTNFILSTGNQTITYNNNGASTLTIANPNAGSSAASGYLASNGTDFFALEIAGTGTAIPGAVGFVSSNATAPLSFTTGGGPILIECSEHEYQRGSELRHRQRGCKCLRCGSAFLCNSSPRWNYNQFQGCKRFHGCFDFSLLPRFGAAAVKKRLDRLNYRRHSCGRAIFCPLQCGGPQLAIAE